VTTTFFLIRHAAHSLLDGTLVGRMPNVHLSPAGQLQAERVARRLAREKIDLVRSSPQTRALETAQPIAASFNLDCEIVEAIDEIDMGEWTGQTFQNLASRADWQAWNTKRSLSRAPRGESMKEVQTRVVSHLEGTARKHLDRGVAVISHADVIKAALLSCLGMSLDHYDRIEIAPASISTLVVGNWGAKLLRLNEEAA
jgi:probable phosphoglycerate mutase